MCYVMDTDDFLILVFSMKKNKSFKANDLIQYKNKIESKNRLYIEFSGSSIKSAVSRYNWLFNINRQENSIEIVENDNASTFLKEVRENKITILQCI